MKQLRGENMKESLAVMRRLRRGSKAILVMLVLLLGLGCGDASSEPTREPGQPAAPRQRELQAQTTVRVHKWDVSLVRKESVLIGSFVTYCESVKETPYIVRVSRQRQAEGLVLTMYVHFPPYPRGCFGGRISVLRWVKIGPQINRIDLYDGSTSPPRRRRDAPQG